MDLLEIMAVGFIIFLVLLSVGGTALELWAKKGVVSYLFSIPRKLSPEKKKKELIKAGIDENSLVIVGGELYQKQKRGDAIVLEKL
ncbi:MAG: hypothetical protein LBC75_11935 [Fibromonadaceae bacterium]|jgi:hypothetical protein|nr:hypothetical protein [Fibromonadaceae bacterium]